MDTLASLGFTVDFSSVTAAQRALDQFGPRVRNVAEAQLAQARANQQLARTSGQVNTAQQAQLRTTVANAQAQLSAVRAAQALERANENVGRSALRAGGGVQNASFQVGDFFTQLASGTGATQALAQQLPQLLGGFGVIGAILGAVTAAAGALFLTLGAGSDPVEQASEAADKLGDRLDEIAEQFGVARDSANAYIGSLTNLSSAQESLLGSQLAATLRGQQEALKTATEAARDAAETGSVQAGIEAGRAEGRANFNPGLIPIPQGINFGGLFDSELGNALDFGGAETTEQLRAQADALGTLKANLDLVTADPSRIGEVVAALEGLGQAGLGDVSTQAIELADELRPAAVAAEDAERQIARLRAEADLLANPFDESARKILETATASDKAAGSFGRLFDKLKDLREQANLPLDPFERQLQQLAGQAELKNLPALPPNASEQQVQQRINLQNEVTQAGIDAQRNEDTAAVVARIEQVKRLLAVAGDDAQTKAVEAQNRAGQFADPGQTAELAKLEAQLENNRDRARELASEQKRLATEQRNAAERAREFTEEQEAQAADTGQLTAALDQSVESYDQVKNRLEALKAARRADIDVTTEQGRATVDLIQRTKDEADALDRLARVRRETARAQAEGTTAPAATTGGQPLEIEELAGRSPEELRQAFDRAQEAARVRRDLGDQPTIDVDQEVAERLGARRSQEDQKRAQDTAILTAELERERETLQRLNEVEGQGLAVRSRVAATIAAEEEVRQRLGTLKGQEAQDAVEIQAALIRETEARSGLVRTLQEERSEADLLSDRLAELARQRAAAETDEDRAAVDARAARERRALPRLERERLISDRELEASDLEGTNDPLAGARAGLLRFANEVPTIAEVTSGAVNDIFGSLTEGIVEAAKTGELSLEGLGTIAEDLLTKLTQVALQQAVVSAIGGLGGAGAAGGAGAGGGLLGLLGGLFGGGAAQAHAGGFVGQTGRTGRILDPALWDDAPRYHAGGVVGLAPDERAIVARTGERVVPAGQAPQTQPRGMNQTVIVNAPPGSQVEQEERDDGFGNSQVEIFISQQNASGIMRGRQNKAFETAFGAKRRVTR